MCWKHSRKQSLHLWISSRHLGPILLFFVSCPIYNSDKFKDLLQLLGKATNGAKCFSAELCQLEMIQFVELRSGSNFRLVIHQCCTACTGKVWHTPRSVALYLSPFCEPHDIGSDCHIFHNGITRRLGLFSWFPHFDNHQK